ncbi:hypothetical protein E2C01_061265 [Portunus trituberculatus]|uniref:Uncharacterized protein n=1 Tax=Portunus trituberculatus TaxID=210409 RepID=A0A5B7H4Q4_PORTR|nr:hypothetical protein [Portunus trituberculatus]
MVPRERGGQAGREGEGERKGEEGDWEEGIRVLVLCGDLNQGTERHGDGGDGDAGGDPVATGNSVVGGWGRAIGSKGWEV